MLRFTSGICDPVTGRPNSRVSHDIMRDYLQVSDAFSGNEDQFVLTFVTCRYNVKQSFAN